MILKYFPRKCTYIYVIKALITQEGIPTPKLRQPSHRYNICAIASLVSMNNTVTLMRIWFWNILLESNIYVLSRGIPAIWFQDTVSVRQWHQFNTHCDIHNKFLVVARVVMDHGVFSNHRIFQRMIITLNGTLSLNWGEHFWGGYLGFKAWVGIKSEKLEDQIGRGKSW